MEKKRKSFSLGWILFFTFVVAYVLVTAFHEPWFDEAEAWQIAKCADLKTIFFVNPHYEGHPPLWHIFLKIPILMGVPYEVGIKTLAGIFSTMSAWLLLFKSPMPKWMRCLFPFGYFLFYQYGVIARPYCMLFLAMILVSIAFAKRNEKPLWFVLSLAFLCFTSAFGIVLAGGISIAWVWELLFGKSWKSVKDFVADRRVWLLVGLLIVAICLILSILPAKNATAIVWKEGKIVNTNQLLYALCMLLSDCFLTSFYAGYYAGVDVTFGSILLGVLAEICIMGSLTLFSPKGHLKYFFIPFSLMVLFTGVVYGKTHHAGVAVSLVLLLLWINYSDKKPIILEKLQEKNGFFKKYGDSIKRVAAIYGVVCLSVPVLWTMVASINEICVPYSQARQTVSFLKETDLDQESIFCGYSQRKVDGGIDYNLIDSFGLEITPYYTHNVIGNLGNGEDNKAYITHMVLSKKETDKLLQDLKVKGHPALLLGTVPLGEIFDDITLAEYCPIYCMENIVPSIWKMNVYKKQDGNYEFVYLRKDLLDQYNLTVLS